MRGTLFGLMGYLKIKICHAHRRIAWVKYRQTQVFSPQSLIKLLPKFGDKKHDECVDFKATQQHKQGKD